VQTTEVTKDPESDAVFFVKPSAPLAPGRYTVSWRGVGDDGHAVTGDFGFSVSAQ
jgi:methionine-rich copper-binding protein CopC